MSTAVAKSRAFKRRTPEKNSAALENVRLLNGAPLDFAPAQNDNGSATPAFAPAQIAADLELAGSFAPAQNGVEGDATVFAPAQNEGETVVSLPIEALVSNPANARRLVSVAALDALVDSLRAHGQVTSVLVFYDEKGRPTMLDGHRRVAGGRQLGWTHIRCEVRPRPKSLKEMYLYSRVANADHETQTPLDDALVWKDLLARSVFPSQSALALAVGVSDSEVSRTLALTELPKTLMLMLVEKPHLLNLRMLSAMQTYLKRHGQDQAEALLYDIEKHSLSARQVERRTQQESSGPVTRPRADRHEFNWSGKKGELRRFDADGRIELSIKNLDAAALQALEDALLKALTAQASLS